MRGALVSALLLMSLMLGLVAVSSPAAAAAGTTRYFVVNDPGCTSPQLWSNPDCWSLTSGGPGGAGQPTINDDAIFDGNGGGGTAVHNAAVAHDLIVTADGVFPQVSLFSDGSLTLAGSVTVGSSPSQSYLFIQFNSPSTFTFGGDVNKQGAVSSGEIDGNDQFNDKVIATKPGAVVHGFNAVNFDSTRGCTIDATDGSNNIASVQNWDETPPYHNTPGERCALPAAPAVVSGTLYGCSAEFNDWFSMLYTIDLGTAVAHPVGLLHDSNGGYFTKCSSLLVKDGRMYTWARPFCAFPDICNISPDLFYYRVDPSNALVTMIADAGPGSTSVTDMALRSDETGFILRGGNAQTTLCASGSGGRLCSLNVDTGATTQVGAVSPSSAGNAIEFDAQGTLLFATIDNGGDTSLFSLSTTTAATTFIANIPNQAICASGSDSPVNAMALAPDGRMLASLNCDNGAASHLTILDTTTGALTDLGRMKMDYGTYVDDALPTDTMDGLTFYSTLPSVGTPPPSNPPPQVSAPPSYSLSAQDVATVALGLAVVSAVLLGASYLFHVGRRFRFLLLIVLVMSLALWYAFR